MNSPKIISAREPVVTNKYIFILTLIPMVIAPFFYFRHLSLFAAICTTVLLLSGTIMALYYLIKYDPKIIELNDKKVTFYGRPKTITLPVSELKKIHTRESYLNKITGTIKLEIESANQTFKVTTKCFDFDKLEVLLHHSS